MILVINLKDPLIKLKIIYSHKVCPAYSLLTILLPKVINFRSYHALSQHADITNGDSIDLIESEKSIKL